MSRQYRSLKLLFNLYKRLMTTCNQLAHSHVSVLLKPLRQTDENESAHFIEWRKDVEIKERDLNVSQGIVGKTMF